MQRKELKKAVKEYSHKTNFYRLGLVRRLLKKQEELEIKLRNAVPKVVCPRCGSHKISIDYDDSEYSSDSWLYCDNCDEIFDDDFGYKDALEAVDCLSWGDTIAIELHFEKPDIKSPQWKQFCEKEILKMLGVSI